MTLSVKSTPYKIPEYSLTGDLLSYQVCGLQYRYQNRGALPPSTPVQLWFGEFIHGVMEEAYRTWNEAPAEHRFPWSWNPEIREIELDINRRLRARGLPTSTRIFCPYNAGTTNQGFCKDANHPHKLLASARVEAAINTWGPHLFPLIADAEVKLKGTRRMPNYNPGISRSNYYGITGIADVITSVQMGSAPAGNLILHHINHDPAIQGLIDSLERPEYEIIIDYKGMRRPPKFLPTGEINLTWAAHEWQILTYGWLRAKQPGAQRPVAGILFYLNELIPSNDDVRDLGREVDALITDILPALQHDKGLLEDRDARRRGVQFSTQFREERSIRVIPITPSLQQHSLDSFDIMVGEIESSVLREIQSGRIFDCWSAHPEEKTCTACDFKTYCPAVEGRYQITVP